MRDIWVGPAILGAISALPVLLGCDRISCGIISITAILIVTAWLLWYRVQLYRLRAWFSDPDNHVPPVAWGPWEDIFSLGYRWRRGEQRRRKELFDTLSQFRESMDILPDALLLLSDKGEIRWANKASQRLVGVFWPKDQGRKPEDFLHSSRLLDFLRNRGEAHVLLAAPGRPDRSLQAQRFPLPDGGMLLMFHDVTRLLQLEQIRQDFVANVSHELRSPLTVLMGFLETMQDSASEGVLEPEEAMQYLSLMAVEGVRMQHLVEDLLTLARLEGNADEPWDDIGTDVLQVVETLYSAFRDLIQEKRMTMVVDVEQDLWVCIPRQDFESIARNLLENAVKYTPSGTKLFIRWGKNQAQEGEGVFELEDTGEGIAPEHVPRLTERFYRVDKGRSRAMGGTGLGLSIVKHAAARYGGRIDLKSELGKGSCFSIYLPVCSRGACEETSEEGSGRISMELQAGDAPHTP